MSVFTGMSQAEVNWLFTHFGGWSEVVDLTPVYAHWSVKCNHAAPSILSDQSDRVSLLISVVELKAFVTPESGSRKRWAGKCPNCAKLYFKP